jgi:hypothetical protein
VRLKSKEDEQDDEDDGDGEDGEDDEDDEDDEDNEDNEDNYAPLSLNSPEFEGLKVEIQITTAVMHAWSEVEHDIFYKNKHGFPNNGTLNRMRR